MSAEVKGSKRKSNRDRVIKLTNAQVHPREGALIFLRVTGIPDLLQIFQEARGTLSPNLKKPRAHCCPRQAEANDSGLIYHLHLPESWHTLL